MTTTGFPGSPNMDEIGPKDVNNQLSPNATVLSNIINSITHLLIGAAASSAFVIAIMLGRGTLSTHIFLCTTGYIILMSLAVLTLSPHTGWTNDIKHSHKRAIHGALQIVGFVLAITGSALVMAALPIHFNTIHGLFGIISLGLLCLTFLGGLVNAFSAKIPINQKFVKICHSSLGIFTLFFAFITLSMGFGQFLWTELHDYANFSISITTFAMIGTVSSALVTAQKRWNS